jgi:hypothetical protein
VYICAEGMGFDLRLGLELLCSGPVNYCIVLQTEQDCVLWQIVRELHATDLLSFFLKRKDTCMCVCTLLSVLT